MSITDPAYPAAFAAGSTGGLVAQVLSPWKGFGKFILLLLALSVMYVLLFLAFFVLTVICQFQLQ